MAGSPAMVAVKMLIGSLPCDIIEAIPFLEEVAE